MKNKMKNGYYLFVYLYKEYIDDFSDNMDNIGQDIFDNPIVWFFGDAEIGPRALGHRSIFANPAKMEHKNLLNQYKEREWWRPVAPIIMENYEKDWFINSFPSKYMLNNFIIQSDKEKIVPAIIHLDGTCRVQTVNKEDSKLYQVVSDFFTVSGIPIICNTSLNDHNEPIINSQREAIEFALDKEISIVYINGYRIRLKKNKQFKRNKMLLRNSDLFVMEETERVNVINRYNPFGLTKEELMLYRFNPRLGKYNLKVQKDVIKVRRILDKIKNNSFGLLGIEMIANQNVFTSN